MKKKWSFGILALILATKTFAQLSVEDPRVEYLKGSPLVDKSNPRFGWINENPKNIQGEKQTAYEIRVSSSSAYTKKNAVWQSGKVISAENQGIKYAGNPLQSATKYWWQVRVWNKDNAVSEWSQPHSWQMGLLQNSEWKAQWIGVPWQGEEAQPKPKGGPADRLSPDGPPAPYLRKSFAIGKEIKSAVVYTTGLGYFEFYANGQKVSDDLLVPNQTNYGKRPDLEKAYIAVPDDFSKYKVMYLAYDLKPFLKKGQNVIGSILGNGFYDCPKFWTASYGSPRFIAQLEIEYTDGTKETIVSDESWKVHRSGILMNHVYEGETCDARLNIPDWCTNTTDLSAWENAILRKAPYGELVTHTAMPDRITEVFEPTKIEKLGEGHFRVAFPVEISGWVHLKNFSGKAGQKINIQFNSNLFSGENNYIIRGDSKEEYSPKFNWFVFSAVEIKGWPGELRADQIVAEAVNTAVEENAHFETSNELFNQINTIWKRSQKDNMHGGIASDCPHRERNGYTGDGQVACPTVMHNFDARAFYQKWVADMREAQIKGTGYVPNGAPWQPGCGGGVAWGAAIHVIPWEYYLAYGDKQMLADNYEAMKGYIRYMQTWVNDNGIMFSQRTGHDGKPLKWWNLGEWAGVCDDCLPKDELVHTFYYWYCLDITAKTAQAMGQSQDFTFYNALAQEAKNAFHQAFYDPVHHSYGNYGANIFALKMGVPDSEYEALKQSVRKEVLANKGHLNTGIFGTRFFFETLAENGMNDLAFAALNKKTEPSFGRWIALGSTTSREHWNEKNSHNHPMFGGGLVWFYRYLAGFQYDEKMPGAKHIIFRPEPVQEMDFVEYETQTNFGKAGIHWKKSKGKMQVKLLVPVGCTASFYPPNGSAAREFSSGEYNLEVALR
ncbi:glycoside hydrolase family 78 protein [Marinilongibacter aquaticus]|uniref:glycoside hydrolase family 78 protein n=1 Tax=Marinilongibacter aquaticus TaxID=2975157 RepID=UPI0021BD9DC6|nr:glycoside hydrolase family 78 protein [Marinilongibacter aquaticus]UBM58984.1 glycoside hydrolase family 78 protein [Marinilongibacter aquaticus]